MALARGLPWLLHAANPTSIHLIDHDIIGNHLLCCDALCYESHVRSCRGVMYVDGGRLCAVSTGSQRSSRLLSMRDANVLLCIPQGTGKLTRGKFCSCCTSSFRMLAECERLKFACVCQTSRLGFVWLA